MSIQTWEERLEGTAHFDLQGYEEDRDAFKLEEIDELRAEVLRLAGEVSNRNARALEGDKVRAAFNLLYIEHEKLQLELRECSKATTELEKIRRQEPIAILGDVRTHREVIWYDYNTKLPVGTKLYVAAGAQPVPEVKNITTAPDCLNTNDKAFWVTGWNECRLAMLKGAKEVK